MRRKIEENDIDVGEWSIVKCGADGYVVEIAEKVDISGSVHPL